MSAASRDHTTPFKQKNNKANRRQYEPPADQQAFLMRMMGESRETSVTIHAASLSLACRRFAESRWEMTGRDLKDTIYIKIESYRWIVAVDGQGNQITMGF
tara:strand:- start:369 stop:671 length:303 start_codon:yes stop_codon:yes gene_type:complete